MHKYILIALGLFTTSCGEMMRTDKEVPSQPTVSWTPVIVKKKYSEQKVEKDFVFGTGNWHSTMYYIVDTDNKIWNCIDQKDFIICDVGDTLWTQNKACLSIKKD